MGPSQICGCPFREPRVFTIAHIYIYIICIYDPYDEVYMIYVWYYIYTKELNHVKHIYCRLLIACTSK